MLRAKRLILINRDFQLRYALVSAVVGVLTTLLTALVILAPLFYFKFLVVPRFLPWPILAGMVLVCVVNVLTIMTFGLYVTHKIAGPMFALCKHMRVIEEGRIPFHLNVRSHDDLQLVVRNFNGLIDGLREAAEHDLSMVQQALSQLQPNSTDESSSEQPSAKTLRALASKIQYRLNTT